MIAMGRLEDIPHIKHETMVNVRPVKIVGFRPNLSEARPQMMAVIH